MQHLCFIVLIKFPSKTELVLRVVITCYVLIITVLYYCVCSCTSDSDIYMECRFTVRPNTGNPDWHLPQGTGNSQKHKELLDDRYEPAGATHECMPRGPVLICWGPGRRRACTARTGRPRGCCGSLHTRHHSPARWPRSVPYQSDTSQSGHDSYILENINISVVSKGWHG